MITRDQAIGKVLELMPRSRLSSSAKIARAVEIVDALGIWLRPYEKGQYITITMPDREPQVFKIADVDPDGTCHLVRGDFDRSAIQLSFDTPWT